MLQAPFERMIDPFTPEAREQDILEPLWAKGDVEARTTIRQSTNYERLLRRVTSFQVLELTQEGRRILTSESENRAKKLILV